MLGVWGELWRKGRCCWERAGCWEGLLGLLGVCKSCVWKLLDGGEQWASVLGGLQDLEAMSV